MTTEKDQDNARNQAAAQLRSIINMVFALDVDYDRLEELKEESENLPDGYEIDPVIGGYIWKNESLNKGSDRFDTEEEATKAAWADAFPEDAEELAELEDAANGCTDEEEARQTILDDALDVQIRSGWMNPGEDFQPEEFTILLCTGGPAVRIMGELNEYNEPCRAWIEYQDWSTSWTEFVPPSEDFSSGWMDALLMYSRQFYFGE